MLDKPKNVYLVRLSDPDNKLVIIYHMFIVSINILRVIPHLIAFAFHPQRDLILSDTYTVKNLVLSLIFSKHYRNLFYYRVGNSKYFFKWILPEEKSIHIPVRMQLGKSALFVHNISSYLNAKSIGDFFVCYQHVTIGTNRVENNEKPTIGSNVTICTGAVIVGGITIGDNVTIGANTVVIKNVPSDSVVVGNPAKIVKLNGERVNILL